MNIDDTRRRIAEIQARAEKATPGPWEYGLGPYGWDDGIIQSLIKSAILTNSGHSRTSASEDDSKFIAYSREDVPWLCEELLAARERLAEVRRRAIVDFYTGTDSISPHWAVCRVCSWVWKFEEAELHEKGCPIAEVKP